MKTRFMVIAGSVLAVLMCSCQGRTRENMVPLGDTVEVDIIAGYSDEKPADSAPDYQN